MTNTDLTTLSSLTATNEITIDRSTDGHSRTPSPNQTATENSLSALMNRNGENKRNTAGPLKKRRNHPTNIASMSSPGAESIDENPMGDAISKQKRTGIVVSGPAGYPKDMDVPVNDPFNPGDWSGHERFLDLGQKAVNALSLRKNGFPAKLPNETIASKSFAMRLDRNLVAASPFSKINTTGISQYQSEGDGNDRNYRKDPSFNVVRAHLNSKHDRTEGAIVYVAGKPIPTHPNLSITEKPIYGYKQSGKSVPEQSTMTEKNSSQPKKFPRNRAPPAKKEQVPNKHSTDFGVRGPGSPGTRCIPLSKRKRVPSDSVQALPKLPRINVANFSSSQTSHNRVMNLPKNIKSPKPEAFALSTLQQPPVSIAPPKSSGLQLATAPSRENKCPSYVSDQKQQEEHNEENHKSDDLQWICEFCGEKAVFDTYQQASTHEASCSSNPKNIKVPPLSNLKSIRVPLLSNPTNILVPHLSKSKKPNGVSSAEKSLMAVPPIRPALNLPTIPPMTNKKEDHRVNKIGPVPSLSHHMVPVIPHARVKTSTINTNDSPKPPPDDGPLQWVCEFCEKAVFDAYEDTVNHEIRCASNPKNKNKAPVYIKPPLNQVAIPVPSQTKKLENKSIVRNIKHRQSNIHAEDSHHRVPIIKNTQNMRLVLNSNEKQHQQPPNHLQIKHKLQKLTKDQQDETLQWVCDYCKKSLFDTHKEACDHEAKCEARPNKILQIVPQIPALPKQQQELEKKQQQPPPIRKDDEGPLQWVCEFCKVAVFDTYDDACDHEQKCVHNPANVKEKNDPVETKQHKQQPPRGKMWFCEFCKVAVFDTFDEACNHEKMCRQNPANSKNQQETESRNDPPGQRKEPRAWCCEFCKIEVFPSFDEASAHEKVCIQNPVHNKRNEKKKVGHEKKTRKRQKPILPVRKKPDKAENTQQKNIGQQFQLPSYPRVIDGKPLCSPEKVEQKPKKRCPDPNGNQKLEQSNTPSKDVRAENNQALREDDELQWVCAICEKAVFDTFQDAVTHEQSCTNTKGKNAEASANNKDNRSDTATGQQESKETKDGEDSQWVCSICATALFDSYEEAVAHEQTCGKKSLRGKKVPKPVIAIDEYLC